MNDEDKRLTASRWTTANLSVEDFNLLNEEIAGMARAGLPLDQGLSALAREMGRGKLQRVTAAIAADLQAGQTLPQALERQAGALPAFYAHLMAAGIRAGKVGDALTTLTVYSRAMADLRAQVFGALLYPVTVLAISILLVLGLLIFLVPMFEQIFVEFRMKLPMFTAGLLHVARHPVYYVALPLLALVVLGCLLRFVSQRSTASRLAWAQVQNNLPLIGTLVRSARVAAFTDLLGILVDNGVPLPEAFRLAGEASRDPLLQFGCKNIEADLAQGVPLGLALSSQRTLPEVVGWMIGQGEKSGTLGATLHRLADMYRRQAERRATLLRSLLPSFMVLIIAIAVGGLFVVTLLLPMFNLIQALGGNQ